MEQLEIDLDKWYSIWTRVRFADYSGFVSCYTCPARLHWSEGDCGHWHRRGNDTTRWHEDNGRFQCRTCNRDYNGRPEVFEVELRMELGDERVEAIRLLAKEIDQRQEAEKKELLIHYQKLVRALGVAGV